MAGREREGWGRGPRSYRRAHDRIKEDLCERLTQHGQLDAGNIEIDLRDGEVTLRGAADRVICASMPEPFHAVGLWYADFSQTTDEQVRALLAAATT